MNQLVDYLYSHEGWHYAADLSKKLKTCKRIIRLLTEESDGLVVTSDNGYAHISHVLPSEAEYSAKRLCSYARSLLKRANEIRKQNRNHHGKQ